MKRARGPSSFAQRLDLLEAKAGTLCGGERQQAARAAASALFDSLWQLYPADPWAAGLPRLSTEEKLRAAAARAQAGTMGAMEVAALQASVPRDALELLGIDAVGALVACAASAAAQRAHP